jgi:hypothetical protein
MRFYAPRRSAVGVFLAVLDVVLLLTSHAPFQWLFVVSNLGKILVGYIGGGRIISIW